MISFLAGTTVRFPGQFAGVVGAGGGNSGAREVASVADAAGAAADSCRVATAGGAMAGPCAVEPALGGVGNIHGRAGARDQKSAFHGFAEFAVVAGRPGFQRSGAAAADGAAEHRQPGGLPAPRHPR